MRDKDLLKALLKDGWTEVRVHGSHHIIQKTIKLKPFPYTVKMFRLVC